MSAPVRVLAPRGVRADVVAHARYLFFSNEMVGLGHLRRTLAIAGVLAQADAAATSLVLTGAGDTYFPLPPRVDTVKLPTRGRDEHGNHRAQHLALALHELHELRANISRASSLAFRPDVAIVDKLPLGPGGELLPTLEALKASGCRLVLGLRDIEDDPGVVRATWDARLRETIVRLYDAILVYGPPSTPDALDCAGWHDLEVPTVHVGYVASPTESEPPRDLPEDYVLATAGGGADGFRLLSTFAETVAAHPLPCPAVIVSGPLMSARERRLLARLAEHAGVRICEFRDDMDAVIAGARAVVSMAGYNTVAELARTRTPALLVPRARPSHEQLVRARLLAREGLQQMLHPDDLDRVTLRAALERLLARERPPFDGRQHRGAERAVQELRRLARRDEGIAPAVAAGR
jgi:predicted glycosyltransferase